jgi:hypothetical protein
MRAPRPYTQRYGPVGEVVFDTSHCPTYGVRDAQEE